MLDTPHGVGLERAVNLGHEVDRGPVEWVLVSLPSRAWPAGAGLDAEVKGARTASRR